jgi:hypothetical protein
MTTTTVNVNALPQVPVLTEPVWTLSGLLTLQGSTYALPFALSNFVLVPLTEAAPEYFSNGLQPLCTATATGTNVTDRTQSPYVITLTFPTVVRSVCSGADGVPTGCGPAVGVALPSRDAALLQAAQFQAYCNSQAATWASQLTTYDPAHVVTGMVFTQFTVSGGCGLYSDTCSGLV